MKRLHFKVGIATIVALGLNGIAIAEVVAVVSAASPVISLSKQEVTDIFLGRMRHFPDGTVAMPIDQAEGATARDEFYSKFAAKSPAQIKAYWSKIIFTGRGRPPPLVASSAELKRRLAANPAAIGYLERSMLDSTVRELR